MDVNADACSTNLLNAAAPASVAHADPKCVHRPHIARIRHNRPSPAALSCWLPTHPVARLRSRPARPLARIWSRLTLRRIRPRSRMRLKICHRLVVALGPLRDRSLHKQGKEAARKAVKLEVWREGKLSGRRAAESAVKEAAAAAAADAAAAAKEASCTPTRSPSTLLTVARGLRCSHWQSHIGQGCGASGQPGGCSHACYRGGQ